MKIKQFFLKLRDLIYKTETLVYIDINNSHKHTTVQGYASSSTTINIVDEEGQDTGDILTVTSTKGF